jgi:hypothetical protein
MTTRKDIVKKLISEGFNKNTLIMMSDNELKTLCKTLFNEGVGAVVMDTNTPPDIIKKVTDKGMNVKLSKPGQTNEKLEGKEDVCPICGMKECTCEDKKHGKKTKNIKGKKEKTEISEWVLSLAESKFTKFTSKKDIMGIINEKVMETSNPMPGKAKIGHNGVPEFMTYDSIMSSSTKEKEKERETETPVRERPVRERPTEKPKTDDPFSPKPGPNHNPKALAEKKRIKNGI